MEDLQRDPELSPTFNDAPLPTKEPDKEMSPMEKPVGNCFYLKTIFLWVVLSTFK